MPRAATDSWADERRAAGMTDEEINYMRSGGRADLPGAVDGVGGDDGAGDDQRTDDTSRGQDGSTGDQDQGQQGQGQQGRGEEEDDEVTLNQPVPYQKYRREQKRLKDRLAARDADVTRLTGQVTDFNTRMARLDERLRILREAAEASDEANQQETEQDDEPNPDEDPIGWIKWSQRQRARDREELQQTRDRVQHRESMEGMQSAYAADARSFAATQPAFVEAYRWLIAVRDRQLTAAGIRDPQERANMINQDERDLVIRAFRDRQNDPDAPGPAQRLYDYAVASGFQPQQRRQQNGQGQNDRGRQQQSGVFPDNRGRSSDDRGRANNVGDMIDNIERGRAASRSLSGTGGAAPRAGINVDELINMTDEEYHDWQRSLTPAQLREYRRSLGAPERASMR